LADAARRRFARTRVSRSSCSGSAGARYANLRSSDEHGAQHGRLHDCGSRVPHGPARSSRPRGSSVSSWPNSNQERRVPPRTSALHLLQRRVGAGRQSKGVRGRTLERVARPLRLPTITPASLMSTATDTCDVLGSASSWTNVVSVGHFAARRGALPANAPALEQVQRVADPRPRSGRRRRSRPGGRVAGWHFFILLEMAPSAHQASIFPRRQHSHGSPKVQCIRGCRVSELAHPRCWEEE
jgi:hypothetical protein